ncbi:MAG: heme ABC transporter permease CcmC, partial [Pantoea sp.]|nr:heme ABC transporter permease CcmC [Pantoea sp.]
FASRGSLLPGKVVAGLPVMALNVDNVDVNFFRIKPESLSAFVSQWEYRNSLSNWESDELLKMADLASAAMAPVGAVFTFIALVTGSAWGKPMWGTWWIWDARLTSELVLLFIYMGVIALYHAFDDRRTAGRAAGILILVGVVNLPIIHFSVQWWNTLHQGSSGILQQAIAPVMRTPLRWSILGYLLLFLTLTLMRLRNLILLTERHRPWAIGVANKGEKA